VTETDWQVMPYWYCGNSSFYLQTFDSGSSDDVAVIAAVDADSDSCRLVLDLIAAAEQSWDYCLLVVEVINPNGSD
jgi:hypothetical protein